MRTNPSENCLVSEQYNFQPSLYNEEEKEITADNFIVGKLSPDELLKGNRISKGKLCPISNFYLIMP